MERDAGRGESGGAGIEDEERDEGRQIRQRQRDERMREQRTEIQIAGQWRR